MIEANLKRVAAVAIDGIVAAIIAICALLAIALSASPAYAYVDPSVMTYTIQALAGVAVALGAVAGVAFRRTRRAIFGLFKIDENRNKEVEGDVRRVDSDMSSDTPQSYEKKRDGKARRARDTAKWPVRFLRAIPAALFTAFTIGFASPMEIVGGSGDSLIYSVTEVWPVAAVVTGALALVVALVVSLFRGRAFSALNALVFSVGVCFYVQAMFLNDGLPTADGHTVNWGDFAQSALVSGIVWGLIVAAAQVLAQLKQGAVRVSFGILSIVLVIVQAVGVGSLFVQEGENTALDYKVTQDGLYEVSDKSNVIVICLDTTDTAFIKEIYEQDASILNEFTGFTWYQDNSGSLIPTRYGVPFLLTGSTPNYDESFQTYLEERYVRSSFIDDMVNAGYSVDIYTDTTGFDTMQDEGRLAELVGKVDNFKTDYADNLNRQGTAAALMQMALYRDCPWGLKPYFEFTTDSVNSAMVSDYGGATDPTVPYTIDDEVYYKNLKTEKLRVRDKGENGSFKFIHLAGSHVPYEMDANMNRVEESTLQEQNKGIMKMVSEYLRQLKELGVYDCSTIIVTADHGDYYWINTPQQEPTSPILMVKPAATSTTAAATAATASVQTGATGTGSAAGAGTQQSAVTISHAPVSHMDVQATVLEAMGADYSAYGTTVYTHTEGESRVRTYYMTDNNDDNAYDRNILEYHIVGDVLNIQNWKLTGNVWSIADDSQYPALQGAADSVIAQGSAAAGAAGATAGAAATDATAGSDATATATATAATDAATGAGTSAGTGAAGTASSR